MKKRLPGLLDWLKHADDEAISETGTTRAYLRQIAYGHKPASAEVAARTERATAGKVTRKQLRPEDWHVVWPELAGSKRLSENNPTPNEA